MSFRFLMSGESHGQGLTAILEGIPAGFEINPDDINFQLSRRQKGYGRGGRMLIENDTVKFFAGLRHGYTTGAPVCLWVQNKDWENWEVPMSPLPVDMDNSEIKEAVNKRKITHVRPGHADLSGALKYNHEDVRNILERSSARETAIRVAVGGFAKSVLKSFGINIVGHVLQIGNAVADSKNITHSFKELKEITENSEVRCADKNAEIAMKLEIDKAKEQGDSLGGLFEIVAIGVPVGLGSFVHWDRKLDAKVAQAIMSIPAIKSVAIGAGEKAAELFGSMMHDEIYPKENRSDYIRKTNNAGGIEGGMSNGMPIVLRAAMKAIPTMIKPLNSINLEDGEAHVAHYERSDVCAVPAAAVVGEAMLAIVLLEAFLDKFGGDSYTEIKNNYDNYLKMYQSR
ncbi:MAG: chorismate synthase [bacterium]